jgi:ABC-type phosphate/phosphonate transport system permease subunit
MATASWLLVIGLILGGSISASEWLGKRIPKFDEIMGKLSPAKGVIGIAMIVIGLWQLLWFIFNLGVFFRVLLPNFTLSAIVLLISIVIAVVLGFFLARDVFKNREELPQEKIDAIEAKIAKYKTTLGVTGIAAGIYLLLWGVIGWVF